MISPDRQTDTEIPQTLDRELSLQNSIKGRYRPLELTFPLHPGALRSFRLADVLEIQYGPVSHGLVVTDFVPRLRVGLEPIFNYLWSFKDGQLNQADQPLLHTLGSSLVLRPNGGYPIIGLQPVESSGTMQPLLIPYDRIYRNVSMDRQIQQAQDRYQSWQKTKLFSLRAASALLLLGMPLSGILYYFDRGNVGQVPIPFISNAFMAATLYRCASWLEKKAEAERTTIARRLHFSIPQLEGYFI